MVRCLIFTLLCLALGGFHYVSSGGPLNVVFLIDESASVSAETREAAYNYVRSAIQGMDNDARAGVVLFGEQAIVDRALDASTEWTPLADRPATVATDIGAAIQAGGALFAETGARRLVLLSDGIETIGDARALARTAALSGVQLSVVPLGSQAFGEVAVERVVSPNDVPSGQEYEVRVLLNSTNAREVTVTLTEDGVEAGKKISRLRAGENVVSFTLTADEQGFRELEAEVSSVDDRYTENNQASSFTIVTRPPSVLIVASSAGDGEPLRAALQAGGLMADLISPEGLPSDLERLAEYDTVVLANVSSQALGLESEERLQSYVRDRGRGLLMIGGELSFGAGGYGRSPIEQVLPVAMDVRTNEERASLAITFVVDKSGSMARCHGGGAQQFSPTMQSERGINKLDMTKQAVSRAAAALNSGDTLGVVGFDQAPYWLINLQPVASLGSGAVEQLLQPVVAEGGPSNIFSGLETAIAGLKTSDARLKHIIVMSDGWTQQADFSTILATLAAEKITLSTVGVGEGPGASLKEIADRGGGRYYAATDVTGVPDIVLKETVQLLGDYYVEGPFVPVSARDGPLLGELGGSSLPPLLGYNAATLKPNADAALVSPTGDPILAYWQYGLGRAVAWTPDAKGRWATEWVKWPRFSQFASQVVGWTLPRGDSVPGLEAQFTLRPSAPTGAQDVGVRVESVDVNTVGLQGTVIETTLVLTRSSSMTLSTPLSQSLPGVFEGTVSGLEEGVYPVRIEQLEAATGSIVARRETGVVVPYPSEYRVATEEGANAQALLTDVAQLGNGKELDIALPSSAFDRNIAFQPQPVNLTSWLLIIAILLFPVDVAIRRLTLTRSEMVQLLRRQAPDRR